MPNECLMKYCAYEKSFQLLLVCLLTIGAHAQLKPRVAILTDIGRPDLADRSKMCNH